MDTADTGRDSPTQETVEADGVDKPLDPTEDDGALAPKEFAETN
jgi:hypothetical protein